MAREKVKFKRELKIIGADEIHMDDLQEGRGYNKSIYSSF